MEIIQIQGGRRLSGSISLQGSKNGALPLMAASLLVPGRTVLKGCPRIADTYAMADAMKQMGCTLQWQNRDLIIDASLLHTSKVPREYAQKLRSSVLFMGSLLGRTGLAILPYPGGCTIGARPVDFHLEGIQKMGVLVWPGEDWIRTAGRPKGGRITLPAASVGATENLLLAAAGSEEPVTIQGCAREPEVVCLCRFLRAIGVEIQGMGTGTLIVKGTAHPREIRFQVPGDRIVAGTYLLAAAGTGGEIRLVGIRPEDLTGQMEIYRQLGLRVFYQNGVIHAVAARPPGNVEACVTAPYPGFPTDLQSPLMAVLACADGESSIEETVFEQRFQVAGQLGKMGARITVEGQKARITGVSGLRGQQVEAKELRGGAALIIAGLMAKGTTEISGVEYIQRGYEDMVGDLRRLGADIRRVQK